VELIKLVSHRPSFGNHSDGENTPEEHESTKHSGYDANDVRKTKFCCIVL